MPDEPTAPRADPSSDEQQRLEDFLEYRARAGRKRRRTARTRVTAWTLACTVVLLAAIVLGSRVVRHQASAPARVAVDSPPIMAAARDTADDAAPDPSAAPQPLAPASEPGASPASSGQASPTGSDPQPPQRDAARRIGQPRDRLAALVPWETKERVFERFPTTFQRQGQEMVQVEGMRLRARARSPQHPAMEVADVQLDDGVHWFLFADERLLAWGRPQEWCATAARHHVEVDYPAAPCPAASGTN
jgi:hypothetical protein